MTKLIAVEMTDEEQLLFWKTARKLIKENYGGKHCHKKYMDFRCAGCLSGLMESWVDMHCDSLMWAMKEDKKK